MAGKKGIHMITFILLVIGGLNWLAFALFKWEVGSLLGGMDSMISKIVYILVGLSALYELVTHKSYCKNCGHDAKPMASSMPGTGQM